MITGKAPNDHHATDETKRDLKDRRYGLSRSDEKNKVDYHSGTWFRDGQTSPSFDEGQGGRHRVQINAFAAVALLTASLLASFQHLLVFLPDGLGRLLASSTVQLGVPVMLGGIAAVLSNRVKV